VERLEMKNITLSIDEVTLKAGREYARKHNMSFNSFVRQLIQQNVLKTSAQWLVELFELMDKAKANSAGKKWKRQDLHRV
jgi:hypothetical protein